MFSEDAISGVAKRLRPAGHSPPYPALPAPRRPPSRAPLVAAGSGSFCPADVPEHPASVGLSLTAFRPDIR